MNITARFTNESIAFRSEIGNDMSFKRVIKTIIANRYDISLGQVKVDTRKDDFLGVYYLDYIITINISGETYFFNTACFLYNTHERLEKFFEYIFSQLYKFDKQLENSKIYFNVKIDGTKFEVTNKDEKMKELEDRLKKYIILYFNDNRASVRFRLEDLD